MAKISKKSIKANKHGSATIFLSVILSSIIIVNAICIAAVIDMDRRVTINRGLKLQVESILCDYNRELFEIYGIYAFSINGVDDVVFKSALASNGYEFTDDLVVDGYKALDADKFHEAVASYYANRGIAIALNGIFDMLRNVMNGFNDTQVSDYLSDISSSEVSGTINEIISQSSEVTDILENASQYDNLSCLGDSISELIGILDDFSSARTDLEAIDFNPESLSGVVQLLNNTEELLNQESNLVSDNLYHICAAHYASTNFDCSVEKFEKPSGTLSDDSTLNGTSFSSIHSSNLNDSEFILTGFASDESLGKNCFGLSVFGVCLMAEIISVVTDEAMMSVIKGVASVISVIVDILTIGAAAAIPVELYQAVIVFLVASVMAVSDLLNVFSGKSISIAEISCGNELPDVSIDMNYRDFLFLFMILVPDETLDERMTYLINRDFPESACGVTVSTTYRDDLYVFEKTYEMYEN